MNFFPLLLRWSAYKNEICLFYDTCNDQGYEMDFHLMLERTVKLFTRKSRKKKHHHHLIVQYISYKCGIKYVTTVNAIRRMHFSHIVTANVLLHAAWQFHFVKMYFDKFLKSFQRDFPFGFSIWPLFYNRFNFFKNDEINK